MLEAYAPEGNDGAMRRWFACGGDVTYHRMQELPAEDREKILNYVEHLPEQQEICVSGQVFHLVHARPGKQSLQRLWHRPWAGDVFFPDKIAVVGHTPTVYFGARAADGSQKIFFDRGFIAIDCGCGRTQDHTRRLACLRLEDMKEFYV